MANKYAGTQTEKNLMEAFSGESQARNKYTYFASKAKKEGFEQISSLFLKLEILLLISTMSLRIFSSRPILLCSIYSTIASGNN